MALGSAIVKVTKAKNPTSLINSKQTGVNALVNVATSAPTGGSLGVNANGQVVPNPVLSSNPYTANAQNYQNEQYKAYNAQYNQLKQNRDYQQGQVNSAYNAAAQNAYSAYMNARKNQNEIASNNGMTGGAVERMDVQNRTQFNKNTATNEAGRAKGLTDAENEFSNNANSALLAYQTAVNDKNYEMKNARIAAEEQARQQSLSIFAETVGRYDTTKKCNAAIEKLKNSKDPDKNYKIWILQNQKAAVKAMKKKK